MKRLIAACAVLLGGVVAVAQAQDREMGPMGGMRIHADLKLTDTQKTDFEKLRADHQKNMIDQMAKVASARVDLRQLLTADKPDRTAIEKKMQEMAGLMSQAQSLRLDFWFAVNKSLTPEQQKVWKRALERPMEMRGGGFRGARFGRGMGPGRMPGHMPGQMDEMRPMRRMRPDGPADEAPRSN